MDTFDLMQAKYEAMEKATSTMTRSTMHNACNCAMLIIASEMGLVKMIKRFFPSEN